MMTLNLVGESIDKNQIVGCSSQRWFLDRLTRVTGAG